MNIASRRSAPPTGTGKDDPRQGWFRAGDAAREAAPPELGPDVPGARGTAAPLLRRRRDGILPAVAGALSVRGTTLTGTGSRTDVRPELHPLVEEFLDALPVADRERHAGRCPEPLLLSRYLTSAEEARSGRKAGRPFTASDARKALKHARLTTRHLREDGDPRHGSYAPPCRSCARLLAHLGVAAVDPGSVPAAEEKG
ncbi:YwqJ-related putative deaminase [Streptomyces sp. TR06-5]|uniref:YwqJ-related putative deaminase n=1 Tax=unclassified Streptomyces TaxID=2593676 RepID=UPI0039A0F474